MKIAKNLNFIVPIYGDDNKNVVAHAHSTPLWEDVADKYFLILAQTFSQIFSLGLGAGGGPGVAAKLLKSIAIKQEIWDDVGDSPGIEKGLIEEIRRLTSVIALTEKGWHPLPLQHAVDRGFLTDRDRREVENAIVFFIAVSATLGRAQAQDMMETACVLWNARLSLLNSTEFAASLPKSTATASFGEKKPAAAPPMPLPVPRANATVDGKPASLPS